MDNLENTDYETVILTREQALIYYGVESTKPFEINAHLANTGEMLRHAREHRKISVELLGDKINLGPEIIRQIEANRYQEIGGEAFIKGYINLIARELDADSEPVLKVYDALKRRDEHSPEEYVKTRKHDPWGSIVILSILGAAVLIATAVYYFRYSTVLEESANRLEKKLNDTVIYSLDELSDSYGPSFSAPRKKNNYEAELETGQLTLRAKAQTWIEIVDNHGIVIYRDIVNANQTFEFLGNPPYYLIIEDGKAIDLAYQGHTIDFSDALDSEGMARFRLGDF